MGVLKITIDKAKYEIDLNKITLGEGRFLKKNFGMSSYSELSEIDPDPDVLVGVLAVAIKREHPELDEDEILAKVEALPNGDYFEQALKALQDRVKKAEADAKDPQSAGGKGSAPARRTSSAATQKTNTPQS
jgi:hypothetical protein